MQPQVKSNEAENLINTVQIRAKAIIDQCSADFVKHLDPLG